MNLTKSILSPNLTQHQSYPANNGVRSEYTYKCHSRGKRQTTFPSLIWFLPVTSFVHLCVNFFFLHLNILWRELLRAIIAKAFSPNSNTITLHNPAAWQRESRKSSLCLPWAHRLSPCSKPAQTEVFITEEEWAQKRGEYWMKRWRWHLLDLSWMYRF